MTEKNKKLFQEEIPELLKMEGKERAADIDYLTNYVKRKEGEDGYNSLIKELKKYGFKIPDFENKSKIKWISAGIPHAFLVGAARYFDWSEKDVFEMGKQALTMSVSLKIFMRYFVLAESSIQKSLNNWQKYYSWGEGKLLSFNKKKKEGMLELSDFWTHPLVCIYLEGVFSQILEISTGSNKAKVKEIEYQKEDNNHKFKLTW